MSRTSLRLIAAAAAGATAAGAARLAYSAANRRPPGGPKVWSRTNHRGEPVTLLEGPAVAAGAIVGVLVQTGLASAAGSPGRRRAAALILGGTGAAAFGAALALLPEDLGERAMLGDAGANALGAMLGASAAGLPRPARTP